MGGPALLDSTVVDILKEDPSPRADGYMEVPELVPGGTAERHWIALSFRS